MPEEWVFGTVWSIPYPIIIAVNVYIIIMLTRDKIGLTVAIPFWLNLFFNLLFTPLQFDLRNNWLAMIDIYLVLITIACAIIAIWPSSMLAALAFIPYLIWVLIATALQTYITLNNK